MSTTVFHPLFHHLYAYACASQSSVPCSQPDRFRDVSAAAHPSQRQLRASILTSQRAADLKCLCSSICTAIPLCISHHFLFLVVLFGPGFFTHTYVFADFNLDENHHSQSWPFSASRGKILSQFSCALFYFSNSKIQPPACSPFHGIPSSTCLSPSPNHLINDPDPAS
jgi:hypothetical protein